MATFTQTLGLIMINTRLTLLALICSTLSYSQSEKDYWEESLNGLWDCVLHESYVAGEVKQSMGVDISLYVSDSVTTFLTYPCGGFRWVFQSNWSKDSLIMEGSEFQSTFRYGIEFLSDTLILSKLDSSHNFESTKEYFVRNKDFDFHLIRNLLAMGHNPICFDSTVWKLMSYDEGGGEQIFLLDSTIIEIPQIIEIGTNRSSEYSILGGNITLDGEIIFSIESVGWRGQYPTSISGMILLHKKDDINTSRRYLYVFQK